MFDLMLSKCFRILVDGSNFGTFPVYILRMSKIWNLFVCGWSQSETNMLIYVYCLFFCLFVCLFVCLFAASFTCLRPDQRNERMVLCEELEHGTSPARLDLRNITTWVWVVPHLRIGAIKLAHIHFLSQHIPKSLVMKLTPREFHHSISQLMILTRVKILGLYQWPFQEPKLEVSTIYKSYGPMYGLNFREYPDKIALIWIYMVQSLHSKILKFPLTVYEHG